MITSELKSSKDYINLTYLEACDGFECLIALYLYNKNNIKITAVISDETMPHISGSFLSKIIYDLVVNGSIPDINMFMSTALCQSNNQKNYSDVVKKVFPKPLDKRCVKEMLKILKI